MMTAALDGLWKHIARVVVLVGVIAPAPAVGQTEANAVDAPRLPFRDSGFDDSHLLPAAALIMVFLLALAAWRWNRADQDRGGVPGVRPLKPWQAFLFATAATSATFSLRMALDGQLGGQPSLVIFTLPIMLSAYLGGLGAGLLATTITCFGAGYLLLPPIGSFAVALGVDRLQLFFVALAGVFISGLSEVLHRARGRAETASCAYQRAESARRESEEQFSSSFAHSAVGMALVAPDGRFLKVNRALCEMLGYAEAALLALTYQELTFAEDRDDKGLVRRLQAGEIDSFQMEKRYLHQLGRLVTVLLSVSIVRDETGRPIHQIAQVQDISERKAHELEIERLTRLYSALSQINQAIVRLPTRDELFGTICRALVEDGGLKTAWIGWPDAATLSLIPVAAWGDEDGYFRSLRIDVGPGSRGPVEEAFREGRPYVCADVRSDPMALPRRPQLLQRGIHAAAVFPILQGGRVCGTMTVYAAAPHFFQDKEIGLLAEAALDISFALDNLEREEMRRRAEEANVRALQRLTEAQRIGKIGDWELDVATGGIIWSQQTFEILGRDPALGPPGSQEESSTLYEPESAALRFKKVAEVIATGEAREYELVALRPDGERVFIYAIAVPRKDRTGAVVGVYGTVQDVSARKEAEVATARLAAIVTSSDDAIIGKDLNGVITSWNDGAEQIFGYTAREMIGASILRLIPPARHFEEVSILETVKGGKNLKHFETVRQRKDGQMLDVAITISPIKDSAGRIIGASKIARDITDWKRTTEQLQRSEASLANAQRIARIGNWDLEIATGALDWSEEIYEIFGYSRSEFGASFEAFMATVHPDDRVMVRNAQRAAITGEAQLNFEHRIVRPDGTERIVHELADITRDDEGQPVRLAGTVQDVTERVQAAIRLRESEAQFHTMLDAMPLLAWMAEVDGSIYWYNQQWYDYTGTTPEQMQGWGWQRVHDPAYLQSVVERWQAAIKEGTFFEMDFPLRSAAGTYRWFMTRVVPLKDSCGRVLRWCGTNTDITAKRVAAEEIASLNATLEQRVIERTEALRESEQRLAIAVQAAQAGVWAWDIPSGQLIWSPEVFRIFGVDPTEPASLEKWQGLVHPEDLAQAKERMANAVTNRTRLENEYRVVPRSGDVRWVSILGDTSFADDGEPRRMSGVCLDITERKRSELELRKLTAELQAANQELETFSTAVTRDLRVAEAADRIKSAFLATMSHELRTPLNSIIGFTGIVLMGKAGSLTAEQAKQLGMVRESARHLLALINDVLDLSKIEAGQMRVSLGPFNLPALIERVVAMVAPLAEKKGLLLVAQVAPALGEMLSDRRRVEQILLNLLSNAVKFTDRGNVTLTAELIAEFRGSPDSVPRPAVRFRVTDTGIGIKTDDLALLFQPFQQLDTGLARQAEGTGLGLVISRRLATLLGGEIAAASTESQGSEFTVIIPLHNRPEP